MFAVIVNTITVLIGSTVGLLFKKGIPKRLTDAVMLGIGLCTLYIGISGTLKGENTIVLILSMVLGAIIGTALDIDGAINRSLVPSMPVSPVIMKCCSPSRCWI